MLSPQKDRLDYSNILKPPQGYQLERALGTTYSLDLQTLVASLLPLALAESPEREIKENKVCLLHAIQKIAKKMVVFCEDGQTSFPKGTPSKLLPFIEKMLVCVDLPNKDENKTYASFHPKMWLLKYVNNGNSNDAVYKLIVLSRNLTFSHNWDVCIALEGSKVKKTVRNSIAEPMRNFIDFLKKQIPGRSGDFHNNTKRAILQSFWDELDHVDFSFEETPWENIELMPLGIGTASTNLSNYPLFCNDEHNRDNFKYDDLLVISPFLSKSTIEELGKSERLNGKGEGHAILIACKPELEKLKNAKLGNFENYIYSPKNKVIDGEYRISEDGVDVEERYNQDIHAKVFFVQSGGEKNIYLGSMNASKRGESTNVEMMVRLRTTKKTVTAKQMKEDLFGDELTCPFEKVDIDSLPTKDDDKDEKRAEKVLKEFCRVKRSAVAEKKDQNYTIKLSFESDTFDSSIKIAPLFGGKELKSIKSEIEFDNLPLNCLCDYYRLSIKIGSKSINRLIFISTEGVDTDERDANEINSILNDPEKLSAYLMLVMGETPSGQALSRLLFPKEKNTQFLSFYDSGLYELMLKTASTNPKVFLEADETLKRIDTSDEEKGKIIALFKSFVDALKKR